MQLKKSPRDPSIKPKLAIITSFFNPKNYVNLRANYVKFSNEIEKHADLFPIELSFNGEFFIQNDNVIRIEGDETNVLWQKERLLSIALENLPAEYTNVAWLDCDILFENDNWVEDINNALDSFKVVQVYDKARRLQGDGNTGITSEGIVKVLDSNKYQKVPNTMVGITGFGWAIRREIIDELKFLDTQILGGADALMYFSFFGIKDSHVHNQLTAKWRSHINPWIDKAFELVSGSVGYVRGTITHLYHGTMQKRNYQGRYDLLKSIDFDPSVDLELSENKMWQFKNHSLNTEVAKYFDLRDEDDNVIKVNDYFDNVYVLNLDRSPDKLEKTRQLLSKFNILFERFSAVDGDSIPKDAYDFSNFKPGTGMIENKYALGCLKSHIEIIKDAKVKGYKSILIFEDDIMMDPLFELKLQYLKYIKDWNLIYFGATQYHWKGIQYTEHFYKSHKSLGTYAYAIHESTYDAILNVNKYELAIDSVLSKVQEIYKDTCYTFYPNICVPDVSSSNIRSGRDQKTHSEKMRWPDFSTQKYTYEPIDLTTSKPSLNIDQNNGTKVSIIMMSNLSNYENSRSSAVTKFNRAVESFIHQTYKNTELIIVSDGCELTNDAYIRYFKQYQNIKLVKTSKSNSKWPGSRRQLGINVANGQWIGYLDSDDVLHPEHISTLVSYIRPGIELILNNAECKADQYFPKRAQMDRWGEKIIRINGRQLLKFDRYVVLNEVDYINLSGDLLTYKSSINTKKYSSSKLFHIRDTEAKWEDREARGEDIIFSEKLMKELNNIQIESNTYIVCHIPNILDI